MRRIPLGWLALFCFIISAALFGFILSVTFPRLRQFSGGPEPFDGRFWGYTFAEAQALLSALGAEGRDYYATVQHRADTFYPASYGLSRALCLYWLAQRNGLGLLLRALLVALPCAVMILDWSENAAVATLLASWPQLDADQVANASQLSFFKSAGTMLSDSLLLLLLAIFLFRRFLSRAT